MSAPRGSGVLRRLAAAVLARGAALPPPVETPPPYRARFIGCACDRNFVEPTAVMLASVDANGNVPDAVILVAGFGLTDADRDMLRAGAGRPASKLRVIDIKDSDLAIVEGRRFSREFPPAVLGRLFLADHITQPNARLLTLDSDMIINTSLEYLFNLDLEDEFFAAIHEPPRIEDPNYFNTGITLFDVDMYKHHDIARRCLEWLSRNPDANFPDQDALNAVVGDRWHRLDRLWNWFCYDSSGFTAADYERGHIAHFAGPKPWRVPTHPGLGLYQQYLARLRAKLDRTEAAPRALVP